MLILTRRPAQRLFIEVGSEVIELVVVTVNGKNVWLGITAGRQVLVHSEEMWEKIQAERRARYRSAGTAACDDTDGNK